MQIPVFCQYFGYGAFEILTFCRNYITPTIVMMISNQDMKYVTLDNLLPKRFGFITVSVSEVGFFKGMGQKHCQTMFVLSGRLRISLC